MTEHEPVDEKKIPVKTFIEQPASTNQAAKLGTKMGSVVNSKFSVGNHIYSYLKPDSGVNSPLVTPVKINPFYWNIPNACSKCHDVNGKL